MRLVIIVNKLDNNSLCALSIIPSSTKKEFIPDSGRLHSSVGSKSALKQSHPWFKSWHTTFFLIRESLNFVIFQELCRPMHFGYFKSVLFA